MWKRKCEFFFMCDYFGDFLRLRKLFSSIIVSLFINLMHEKSLFISLTYICNVDLLSYKCNLLQWVIPFFKWRNVSIKCFERSTERNVYGIIIWMQYNDVKLGSLLSQGKLSCKTFTLWLGSDSLPKNEVSESCVPNPGQIASTPSKNITCFAISIKLNCDYVLKRKILNLNWELNPKSLAFHASMKSIHIKILG